LFQDLDKAMQEVIETRRRLGDERLSVDREVQDLIDNLEMDPNFRGQARTRDIAFRFMSQTGATVPQAVQVLSMAASVGHNPLTDAGLEMASEVGRFGARLRIDPTTQADLMKLAGLDEDIEDVDDLKLFLAQIESAAARTDFNSP